MEEEQCMVGDVNIFLTDPTDPSLAELEIMIAGDVYLYKLKKKKKQRLITHLHPTWFLHVNHFLQTSLCFCHCFPAVVVFLIP